jgi:hypothetical protein
VKQTNKQKNNDSVQVKFELNITEMNITGNHEGKLTLSRPSDVSQQK